MIMILFRDNTQCAIHGETDNKIAITTEYRSETIYLLSSLFSVLIRKYAFVLRRVDDEWLLNFLWDSPKSH